jgi:lipopolysaccharide export system protein LptA
MHLPYRTLLTAALLASAVLAAAGARAERADRDKPMVIEADKPGSIDLQRQVVVFNGNVVISQGTMVIRADSVEIRESTDGYRTAVAIGSPARPASYRQKRDAVDESVEGVADRIEFDSRSDVLQLTGNAAVRRLRGTAPADEITGGSITWDNSAELFSVKGGATSPANPSGRVRAVLSPRQQGAATAPAGAASAALKPSRALGEPR